MSGEWTVIDGKQAMEGEEAITDICLLTKKEKVPSGYTVVSSRRLGGSKNDVHVHVHVNVLVVYLSAVQIEVTVDGKKADFAEGGMFGSTKRYLAYTRKVPSALRVSQAEFTWTLYRWAHLLRVESHWWT